MAAASSVTVHTERPVLQPDENAVTFTADVGGKQVDCTITGEALRSQFHSGDKPILQVFSENRQAIGAMTHFLISTSHEFVDGSVVIGPEELRDIASR